MKKLILLIFISFGLKAQITKGTIWKDSLNTTTWDVGSAGSPLYENNFRLGPFPGFTQIPSAHMCARNFRADNYLFLADTTNGVFNGNRAIFLRTHGVNALGAYVSFINNQSGNGDAVYLPGVQVVTLTPAAALTQFRVQPGIVTHSIGTTPTQRDIYLQGTVHNPMSASTATCTEAIGTEITQPTAGAGMTFTNRLGLACVGNSDIFGNLYVSGSITRSVLTPSAILHLGAGSSAQAAIRMQNQTAPSSPTAGEIWYETTRGFMHQGNLTCTGAGSFATTFTVTGAIKAASTASIVGTITGNAGILSTGITSGIGYATGSGSTVTQGTNRTTGVTINAINGAITLVSAAGLVTYQTFVVTNSAVAATDVIIVNQKSGTDLNLISVTNVAAGSFKISFATTGGVTVEQPVFNFAVIKGVAN